MEDNRMLILTRKTGEELVINGNIHVRVLDSKGHRARIGIDAPRHVTVLRREVMGEQPPTSSRRPVNAGHSKAELNGAASPRRSA